MIALPDSQRLSPEDYLRFEERSSTKHEYRKGYAYAMAGTTDAHNTIVGNLVVFSRNHLRGSDCRVYFADVKVRLERLNCFYYPDLFVTCDPRDRQTANYKSFPKLIVEVLSDSTEAFDRGDKFNDYQTLDSLEEYILVNTKQQRVEIFRRHEQHNWLLQTHMPSDGKITMQSLAVGISFIDLYDNVDLRRETPLSSDL